MCHQSILVLGTSMGVEVKVEVDMEEEAQEEVKAMGVAQIKEGDNTTDMGDMAQITQLMLHHHLPQNTLIPLLMPQMLVIT